MFISTLQDRRSNVKTLKEYEKRQKVLLSGKYNNNRPIRFMKLFRKKAT